MQLWDPQTLTLHYNKWTHRATTGFLLSSRSFCSNSRQVSEKTLMTRGPWHSSQATEQGRSSPSLLHVTHPRLGGAGQLVKQLVPLTTWEPEWTTDVPPSLPGHEERYRWEKTIFSRESWLDKKGKCKSVISPNAASPGLVILGLSLDLQSPYMGSTQNRFDIKLFTYTISFFHH